MEHTTKGVLFPHQLPELHRLPAPEQATDLVRWFWIPEWQLPDRELSRQELLPFPLCNLVIDPTGVALVGPTTKRSERVLSGTGWAVGALLHPAAAPGLCALASGTPTVRELRDSEARLDLPELQEQVCLAMSSGAPASRHPSDRLAASALVAEWLARTLHPLSEQDLLANTVAAAVADPEIVRVDQLPDRLHRSLRTLQRVAERSFGLSLHTLIRRRRLQEAAARIRENPGLGFAQLATDLGYADQAHFTHDFAQVIGRTPGDYRAVTRAVTRAVADPPPAPAPAPSRAPSPTPATRGTKSQ